MGKMKCERPRRQQLSRVLFALSLVLLFHCLPVTGANLNQILSFLQDGRAFEEGSAQEAKKITGETQALEETLNVTHGLEYTGQTTAEMNMVHQQDTAIEKASNKSQLLPNQTIDLCTSVAPEPVTNTTSPKEVPHIRSMYPADLFSFEDRRRGWVILHIIGVMYMFISLVIVCDHFFVPALGVITDKLAITDEVTGATFMAAGGSIPRLSAILIGVFLDHSNMYLGTVVCLANFNLLFVIGMCALFSREVLHLTWRPLFRDVSFHILCIILLIIFFIDGVITWWESMMLVTCFAMYVIFMAFYMKIQQAIKTRHHKRKDSVEVISVEDQEKELVSKCRDGPQGSKHGLSDEDETDKDVKDSDKNVCKEVNETRMGEEEKRDKPLSLDWPNTRLQQATYLFLLPVILSLWLTLPDVHKQKSRKFFVVTFLGSILWIAVFSYFMVWWAHQVGTTIGFSDWTMIVVAAETSISDLIASVIVARKGRGDMAVSSSMGRNIFNITVCLPVPWLLNSAFHSFSPVPVSTEGFVCVVTLLLLPLFYIVITIASCRWKMNKALGLTMLLFYLFFQAIRMMFQYEIIRCPV
ncbi:sodium/potassium/calcium exchanger 1-like [Xyrichtys novacula]|uniref:Sodium/potassium/calcium exchanger 1 n=1 Tax=Xyrichtys novacula TaxID=13765 RepID=A0AAV1F6G0_XYRNO|nr:sodium/potassium/calcium exchanger 1-like [Xyrichtys novacula]